LPENTAGRQPQFEQNLRPKISVKNYMSRKILIAVAESPARTQEPGRSGSEALGFTLANVGAAWEGTRCHGRFLLTQQEGNPTPGRPAQPQGLS